MGPIIQGHKQGQDILMKRSDNEYYKPHEKQYPGNEEELVGNHYNLHHHYEHMKIQNLNNL